MKVLLACAIVSLATTTRGQSNALEDCEARCIALERVTTVDGRIESVLTDRPRRAIRDRQGRLIVLQAHGGGPPLVFDSIGVLPALLAGEARAG